MTGLLKRYGKLETAFLYLTSFGLFLIMMVIVVDVVLRYMFNAPLSWSFDLISMYLVTLVFFPALADTFSRGGHIKVDMFDAFRRTKVFAFFEIVGYCTAIVFFSLIFWKMAETGWEAFIEKEVVDGAIPWPTWPPQAFGAVGVGLLLISMAVGIVLRAQALMEGRVFEAQGEHHHAGEHVE
ncbi:TRAP transporter small permease [Ferrovibrio sp. MS7]|jgi:TRAP-type C4-dicarboxylate transport system permease small subunit|uniref:TRAP transporter small permease subunit n=1 Tax=Ferrovibrio plantarum TaxID=3119164 RepID=UPI0031370E02